MNDWVSGWRINQSVNLALLDAVGEQGLAAKLDKGKSVRAHFAHMQYVRRSWLEPMNNQAVVDVPLLDGKSAGAESIREALAKSAEATVEILTARGEKPVPGFKLLPPTFVQYLIAHEAFHRAQIEIALRQSGAPLADGVAFGLWEWHRHV